MVATIENLAARVLLLEHWRESDAIPTSLKKYLDVQYPVLDEAMDPTAGGFKEIKDKVRNLEGMMLSTKMKDMDDKMNKLKEDTENMVKKMESKGRSRRASRLRMPFISSQALGREMNPGMTSQQRSRTGL